MCCMLRFNYCTLQSHFVLELLNMQTEGEDHENGRKQHPFKMIFSISFLFWKKTAKYLLKYKGTSGCHHFLPGISKLSFCTLKQFSNKISKVKWWKAAKKLYRNWNMGRVQLWAWYWAGGEQVREDWARLRVGTTAGRDSGGWGRHGGLESVSKIKTD